MARRTKRLWADEEKRSIWVQTTPPGVSIARVTQRCAMKANLIFKRLSDPRLAPAEPDEACFLPVEIEDRSVDEDAGQRVIRPTRMPVFEAPGEGRFLWQSAKEGKITPTSVQLAMLLEGIDWAHAAA